MHSMIVINLCEFWIVSSYIIRSGYWLSRKWGNGCGKLGTGVVSECVCVSLPTL